jgi:hypothetical protein
MFIAAAIAEGFRAERAGPAHEIDRPNAWLSSEAWNQALRRDLEARGILSGPPRRAR